MLSWLTVTTGGHSEEIMCIKNLPKMLVIQLKRFVRDQDEYIIQDIVNIRRGVGTQEWGQSIHTSRLLGQVSLLCTEWKEVSYCMMSKISCIHVALLLVLFYPCTEMYGCKLQWLLWVSSGVWYGIVLVTTLAKLEGMKVEIFWQASVLSEEKNYFPRYRFLCVEKSKLHIILRWGDPYSD